jgi:peptidoglycan-N-acetylglucosamine deacetylase
MPPARIVLWVASLGGVALVVRSVLLGPVPFAVAIAAFVLYATFTGVGWVFPQLEMYGDVVWRGRAGQRRIALTFDDGPHPESTRKVLRLLAERGLRASFFVVGKKAQLHPEIVREIHEAGHTLGLHGYSHDRLFAFKPPRAVARDIELTQQAIEAACGVRPALLRPPLGHVSPRVAAGARQAHVRLVAWNVMALDGFKGVDVESVVERVTRGVRDGAIVILHDAAERDGYEPASVEALPAILEVIAKRGLRLVGVEEFVAEAEA